MSLDVTTLLLVLGLAHLLGRSCQGQTCLRTNPRRHMLCITECVPSGGCYKKNRQCLCDGDCGYSCVRTGLTCGDPPRLANGRRKMFNGTAFHSKVRYTCKRGFTLTGSSIRTCRASKKWDGEQPRCAKYCADPGLSPMVMRDESTAPNGFRTGTVLHYYCLPNFRLVGSANIQCKTNLKWSHPAPQCVATPCLAPVPPSNAMVQRSSGRTSYQYGTVLRLSCKPGYFALGRNGKMTCVANGRWSTSTQFSCSPRSCGDPGHPRYGKRVGLVHTFRSNVTFQCDHCYTLQGPSYRICGANGRWSDSQPVCQKLTCKTPPDLANGLVNVISNVCDGKVEYSCNTGYKRFGAMHRRCRDGEWTGNEPNCTIVSCGIPFGANSPGLQYTATEGLTYGATVHFRCESQWKMRGSNETTCNAKRAWSRDAPRCFAPCTIPEALHSAGRTVAHDETDKFTCTQGTRVGLINAIRIFCDNGVWKYVQKKTYSVLSILTHKLRCI